MQSRWSLISTLTFPRYLLRKSRYSPRGPISCRRGNTLWHPRRCSPSPIADPEYRTNQQTHHPTLRTCKRRQGSVSTPITPRFEQHPASSSLSHSAVDEDNLRVQHFSRNTHLGPSFAEHCLLMLQAQRHQPIGPL